MIKLWHLSSVVLAMFVGIALAQDSGLPGDSGDWLGTSPFYASGPYYYGSPYSYDVPMSFAQPYYTSPSGSSYYSPYYWNGLFPDYSKPIRYTPEGIPIYYGMYPYYTVPYYQPNWTATINYAQTKSSFRVYQNGAWVPA